MEKNDRRLECKHLERWQSGDRVDCKGEHLADCPKSRSRLVITSACWRVHNK